MKPETITLTRADLVEWAKRKPAEAITLRDFKGPFQRFNRAAVVIFDDGSTRRVLKQRYLTHAQA